MAVRLTSTRDAARLNGIKVLAGPRRAAQDRLRLRELELGRSALLTTTYPTP